MRRGKFIYTPISSQPIGMGRKILINATEITNVSTEKTSSAEIILNEIGELEKVIFRFLISEKIIFQPKKLIIVRIPRSPKSPTNLIVPKIPSVNIPMIKTNIPIVVSAGIVNFLEIFFQVVLCEKIVAPTARHKNTRKNG